MSSAKFNTPLPPATYILGRITTLSDGTQAIQPVHRETVLLHQQKVQRLVQAAEDYANLPVKETLRELKLAALQFAENV